MYYLQFSIACVAPIFLVMLVGLYLKKKKILSKDGFLTLNTLAFQVSFPAMLFHDISKADLKSAFDIKFISFILLATTALYICCWFFGNKFIKSKQSLGSFVQGAVRGNYIVIGLSLVGNIMGYTPIKAVLVVAIIVPFYNIIAIIVLTYCSERAAKISPLTLLVSVLKNPLIISVFIGLIFSLFSIPIPFVFDKAISYLAYLATPVALLSIGGSLEYEGAKKSFNLAMVASFIKLVISPTLACFIAYMLKFDNESLVIIYVLFAAPAAVTSYIMASHMGCDAPLAASVVVFTTSVSVFTYTLGIMGLQMLGIV